ncbi:thioredoxin-like protein [Xylariaceae sp. FL0662B]|nr:thioredoxin-like protein [Xylariaceae sp. FL0662B]
MALAPKFAGQKLFFAPPAPAPGGENLAPAAHTLELFLDYVCPFSAKQFATVYHTVAPLVRAHPRWAPRLQIILRQQVQPWHPSSTLVHEAAAAVLRLAPDRYWVFSDALFRDQAAYFDVSVVNETRNQTYRRLAKLAAASAGVDEDKVYDLLAIPESAEGNLNVGNQVTNDLKVFIKMGRLVGVHVSPTVIFDGVVAGDISSSWTKEQWVEWLTKNID